MAILVVAPSVEVQTERLRSRGDAEDHVERRVALGRSEERDGRLIAQSVIVNDDLEQSVDQLLAIIEDARNGRVPRPSAR